MIWKIAEKNVGVSKQNNRRNSVYDLYATNEEGFFMDYPIGLAWFLMVESPFLMSRWPFVLVKSTSCFWLNHNFRWLLIFHGFSSPFLIFIDFWWVKTQFLLVKSAFPSSSWRLPRCAPNEPSSELRAERGAGKNRRCLKKPGGAGRCGEETPWKIGIWPRKVVVLDGDL